MVRFAIIGAVIAVAFTLYGLIDAAMSDPARARGVSKPVWVVLIVVLPVIGAILWFTIGKGRGPAPAPRRAPDDDPRFTGTRLSDAELDAHMRELEDRLRELDEEKFPGEDPGAGADGSAGGGADSSGSGGAPDGAEAADGSAEPGPTDRPGDRPAGENHTGQQ
jgi:hypothetical protein